MDTDVELYDGKTFKELCKDIVKNQADRKEQIEIFISDLRPMIKSINDAMQIIPLIKQYLDAGINNDEALIKLAQIWQRLMTAQAASAEGGSIGLSEEEKKDLMQLVSSVPSIPITKIEVKTD
jgi:hypothetical protein